MIGRNVRRTASAMPGLDIAEHRSWQNFLTTTMGMFGALNRKLMDAHQLTLADVKILAILRDSPADGARMGDLAEALLSHPSRITRHISRLEGEGLVLRTPRPGDRRVVVATSTDKGRKMLQKANVTYAEAVRSEFLGHLSRPQIAALGESCRQIGAAFTDPE
ncbi:MarR family winged helix-turn-helix transcriptional regulator [Mycobacterium sp. SMC-14]|uniref:MarR family winged helix-turn-helix transcriptional regulator n=1 Tax=Mycobacterium sp. SMC-14 TaxID=3385968 RepID=UPI00390CC495